MEIEWQDEKEKESHPNKCLACHIDEIRRIFNKLLAFYKIKEEYAEEIEEIIEKVINYHDHGKLNKDWEWDKRKSKVPTHSDFSVRFVLQNVLKNKNLTKTEQINWIIALYLILKHHSSLLKISRFKDKHIEEIVEGAVKCVKEWEWKKRCLLADYYGIFKVADILSATGSSTFLPEPPIVENETIKEFYESKDLEKTNEQKAIFSTFKEVGFLRAPTGWGKTFSSPLCLTSKFASKFFLLLPTITAINKLYGDFKKMFGNNVSKYFYFYDFEIFGKDYEEKEMQLKLFYAKNFLKPFVITTVDQILLAFLQLGSYYTKRIFFRNCIFVIDEVHLLNGNMLYLLLHFLKKFMKFYNFSIIFMSATFPTGLKEVIEDKLIEKRTYWNSENGNLEKKYEELKRINFELRLDSYLENEIEKIKEKIEKEKKKILVICNTVEYAVKIKQLLDTLIDEKKVLLLHGRFMYNSRIKREKLIEKLKNKNKPHVLVTTQVAEVSLDISYDYLYTELSPFPSLIQRFGRVNRKGKITEKTNVFIFKHWAKDEKNYPYEPDRIENAKKILTELQTVENEYKLIKKMEEIETKEIFEKELENAEKYFELEPNWENVETGCGYFFSLPITENEARKLLSYREDFSVLMIPTSEKIVTGSQRDFVLSNIRRLQKIFEENIRKGKNVQSTIAALKGFSVNVPYYVIAKVRETKSLGGIYLIEELPKYIYHTDYGFVPIDSLQSII